MRRLESGSRPEARLRSAWVVTGLLVLVLAVLFAVPGVRAEIIRFFQVGVEHLSGDSNPDSRTIHPTTACDGYTLGYFSWHSDSRTGC
jgi:hypothetical protein